MTKVENIHWISALSDDAVLTITDGLFSCPVFSSPCLFSKGYIVNNPILAFNVMNVAISNEDQKIISNDDKNDLSLEIVAIVEDQNLNLVKVGEILIEIDTPIPKDIKKKDSVIFCCSRLDFMG